MSVDFDGCRFGVVDDRGHPIKKPWRLMTTSPEKVEALQGLALVSTRRPCANSWPKQ